MSTDTTAPTLTPKHIAEYLTNASEAFERAVIEDEIILHCFVQYCFALLDKLAVRRHRLREIVSPESEALPDKHIPTADQEEQLLQRFADVVRERRPRIYAVYEENILSQLRRLCCLLLSQHAGYDESQKLLRDAASAIPHEATRPWDNPVRFITDSVTGQLSLGDVTSSTTVRHMLEAQALLKDFEPAIPARKSGRPKGRSKPTGSGRKASVEPCVYIEAWEAKQQPKRNKSIPWWLTFARKKNVSVPEDPKQRDALRKKLEEWAIKGKSLSRKK